MSSLRSLAVAGSFVLFGMVGLSLAAEGEQAKGKKADYAVHTGYFQKNNAGLKGASSYLALATREQFDKIFGVAFIAGAKQNFLPKDAFETKLVAAVIKRGNALWKYQVEKVTADKGTLYVQYKAASKPGGSARFASPLIVSVDRDKLTRIVFIENGKKAGTAEVRK
jgi:hypothetical protein